jgi:hypothetical protein
MTNHQTLGRLCHCYPKSYLELGIQLLLQFMDFSLLCGGEVFGIVAAHPERGPQEKGASLCFNILEATRDRKSETLNEAPLEELSSTLTALGFSNEDPA